MKEKCLITLFSPFSQRFWFLALSIPFGLPSSPERNKQTEQNAESPGLPLRYNTFSFSRLTNYEAGTTMWFGKQHLSQPLRLTLRPNLWISHHSGSTWGKSVIRKLNVFFFQSLLCLRWLLLCIVHSPLCVSEKKLFSLPMQSENSHLLPENEMFSL